MPENDDPVEPSPGEAPHVGRLEDLQRFREALSGFMLNYQFGIDEVMTKIDILQTEFEHLHEYSPIEHVNAPSPGRTGLARLNQRERS